MAKVLWGRCPAFRAGKAEQGRGRATSLWVDGPWGAATASGGWHVPPDHAWQAHSGQRTREAEGREASQVTSEQAWPGLVEGPSLWWPR